MFFGKKARSCFVIGFITTCSLAATSLLILALVLDMWRSSEQANDEGVLVEYVQGITHECARTQVLAMNCYSWKHSITTHKLFQLRELIFALTLGAIGCSITSLFISCITLLARMPKTRYSVVITAADLTAALLSMTVSGVYAVTFLKEPWNPATSYYCLLVATLCIFITFSLRLFTNSLKNNSPKEIPYQKHLDSTCYHYT
ncbi:uncharacterized protein [Clytia hemisphaerica]|uniref:Uncharacterized protein n=1 Tax=Clytia hemisphaerica TaxID=252671 RepID=A0A7M5VA41_9CNID